MIAHSQPLPGDSVTISRVAQAKCVKCLQKQAVKDSIIESKSVQIDELNAFIEGADRAVLELDSKLTETKDELEGMKTKRKRALIFGGISAGVAIIEVFLITLILK